MLLRAFTPLALISLGLVGAGGLAFHDLSTGHLRLHFTTPAHIPFPASNPYTAAKLAFGRAAFYDPKLSGDGSVACAGCHIPANGFTDHLAASRGVTGRMMALRTPTLIDAAWGQIYGWEGKFPSLSAVVTGAMVNPINMAVTEASLKKTMKDAPNLRRGYAAAFPGAAVNIRNVSRGLATYVRTLVAGPAPFDRWRHGHVHAISAAAKRGFKLFEGKARCAICHKGFAFTDRAFHDIGASTGKDLGRGAQFPTSVKLQHAFKTPTLRDVALHAPYMHNGALPTLTAVVNLYNKGGIKRPSLDDNIHPLGLSKQDVQDIVAFLQSLTAMPGGRQTAASLR